MKNKKRINSNDSEEESVEVKVISEMEVEYSSKVLRYSFYTPIDEPSKYIPLLKEMRNLSENDQVEFRFSCPGGDLNTCITLLHAMNTCKAPIKSILDSYAYSAAAILFLNSDSWECALGSSLMFHTFSVQIEGKGHELIDAMDNIKVTYYDVLDMVSKNFLTDLEINKIKDGKDHYISYKEVVKRLEQMVIKNNKIK